MEAALAAGCLHLLLGHHAADQAETVAMRAARGPGGNEGIAAWTARNEVLLLRPLLNIPPGALRAYLAAQNMPWVEDPSNANPKFERVRIRLAGAGAPPAGAPPGDAAARQAREREAAAFLARHATMRPEGFAHIHASSAPPAALAALIRVIGGADYPPAQTSVAALAAGLRPATLGGVRILAAGRWGPGWLLVRELAACAAPVPAVPDARWDNRFALTRPAPGYRFGALGPDAKNYKRYNNLPSAVLRALPALRRGNADLVFPAPALFSPPAPATAHPFCDASQ